MRTRVVLGLILAVSLAAVSCADPSQNSPSVASQQTSFPLSIVDDAQRSVTIDQEPQRLISLAASNTELVYALGLEDKLVGVDDYSDFPPEAKNKERIGSFSKPSLEKIVNLAPDIVLATNIHLKTVVPELEKLRIPVVVFQPPNLDQVIANLQVLGAIGGRPAAAEMVSAELRRRIDAVTTKTEKLPVRPRVYFELGPDLTSVGPNTFVDDMIAMAGGDNIARDASTPWPKLTPEVIVLKDPQVIILSDYGSESGGVTVEMVRGRPGWDTMSAVKSGQIVPLLNTDPVNRPSPRAVEGLEFLAKAIHPELFP